MRYIDIGTYKKLFNKNYNIYPNRCAALIKCTK